MQNRSRYGNMNWSGNYDDQYGQYGQNYQYSQYNQYDQYDDYDDYNQYGNYQGSMGMQRNMMSSGRNRMADKQYNQGYNSMGMGYGGDSGYMDMGYGQTQLMGNYNNQGNNRRRFGNSWGGNNQRKRTASRSMNEPQSKRTKPASGQDTNRRSANSNMSGKGRGGAAQKKSGDRSGSKKTVDKNAPRQYCDVCESTFPTERALRQHLNGRRHKLRKESKDTTSGPGELGPGPFRPFCQTCVDRFEETSWQKHKETPKHIARASLNIFVKKDQDEPEGVEFIEPVSGFYCNLCTRFYSDENHAMGAHCRNKAHVYKVKKLEISKLTDAEIQEYVQQRKEEHDAEVAEKAAENGDAETKPDDEEVDEDKLLADDDEEMQVAAEEIKPQPKVTPTAAAARGRVTRSAITKK